MRSRWWSRRSSSRATDLARVRALIWVESDSQKGILIGAHGRMIKAIGTAARRELERALGSMCTSTCRYGCGVTGAPTRGCWTAWASPSDGRCSDLRRARSLRSRRSAIRRAPRGPAAAPHEGDADDSKSRRRRRASWFCWKRARSCTARAACDGGVATARGCPPRRACVRRATAAARARRPRSAGARRSLKRRGSRPLTRTAAGRARRLAQSVLELERLA